MIFGAWNVRTLLDLDASLKPKRRTALIARELGKYQIDIAALREIRFAKEGSIAEPKGEYIFFWRGKAKDEDRIHGVGLAIKTSLCRQLPDLLTPVSETLLPTQPLPTCYSHQCICAHSYQQWRGKGRFIRGAQHSREGCPPKRQVHPAGILQWESGYQLQELERRTRTSWHREAKLKWSHVVEFLCWERPHHHQHTVRSIR